VYAAQPVGAVARVDADLAGEDDDVLEVGVVLAAAEKRIAVALNSRDLLKEWTARIYLRKYQQGSLCKPLPEEDRGGVGVIPRPWVARLVLPAAEMT